MKKLGLLIFPFTHKVCAVICFDIIACYHSAVVTVMGEIYILRLIYTRKKLGYFSSLAH